MRLPYAKRTIGRSRHPLVGLALIALLLSACSVTLNPNSLPTTIITLPGSTGAIGFDDMA